LIVSRMKWWKKLYKPRFTFEQIRYYIQHSRDWSITCACVLTRPPVILPLNLTCKYLEHLKFTQAAINVGWSLQFCSLDEFTILYIYI